MGSLIESAGVIIYPKSNMSAPLENDFAEGASRKLSEEDARKRKMQGPLSKQCCLVITDPSWSSVCTISSATWMGL